MSTETEDLNESDEERLDRYDDLMQGIADWLGEKGYELNDADEVADFLADISGRSAALSPSLQEVEGYRTQGAADASECRRLTAELDAAESARDGALEEVERLERELSLMTSVANGKHEAYLEARADLKEMRDRVSLVIGGQMLPVESHPNWRKAAETARAELENSETERNMALALVADAWDQGFKRGWETDSNVESLNPYRPALPEGAGNADS